MKKSWTAPADPEPGQVVTAASMESSPAFAVAVSVLQRSIEQAAREALGEFYRQTGVTPSAISIGMVEVTTVTQTVRTFAVNHVNVEFRL